VLNDDKSGLAEFVIVGMDPEQFAMIGALPRGKGVLGALIAGPSPCAWSAWEIIPRGPLPRSTFSDTWRTAVEPLG
jgi:hypothetical protein